MPRSIDVILRHSMVDKVKPGDKCLFTGYLIVVPEIISLLKTGERQFIHTRQNNVRNSNLQGVSGLENLGVRELTYKLIYMA